MLTVSTSNESSRSVSKSVCAHKLLLKRKINPIAVKNLNEKRNNFTASITILRCKVTTFEVLILDQGYE